MQTTHNALIIIDSNQAQEVEVIETSAINAAILLWLEEKHDRTGSAKTAIAYQEAIRSFRASLQSAGLDLDSPYQHVAIVAQNWCNHSLRDREVSPATYNQRRAILSSFYIFAMRRGLVVHNPLSLLPSRPVQAYRGAQALDRVTVGNKLVDIDRSGIPGMRDYALLSIALTTGRRRSELAQLKRKHLSLSGDVVTVSWERCKGGKSARDTLLPHISNVLVRYLESFYNLPFAEIPESAPVWVTLHHGKKGDQLTGAGIAVICQNRLGTSKVHALRHTFAHEMEEAGAKLSEIQERMLHQSAATTSLYLAALNGATNKHAGKVAVLLGIE